MKIIETLEKWKPNIRLLADKMVLGPQRDLLEKLNRFNQAFGTDIGITKTYRWSPGIYNKIREAMFKVYQLNKTKRSKLSTIFNAHSDSQWRMSRMIKMAMEIENAMVIKRNSQSTFQDNTLICEESITYLLERSREALHNISSVAGIKCNSYIAERDNSEYNSHNSWSQAFGNTRLFLVLEIILAPYDMSIYLHHSSEKSYGLPMEETKIYLYMNIDGFVNGYAKGTERADSGKLTNEDDRMVIINDVLRNTVHLGARGNYDRKYFNHHPYIGRQYGPNERLYNDDETINEPWHNICAGSFHLNTDFIQLKWESLIFTVNSWLTMFTNGRTNPLNHVKTVWNGKLPFMDKDYVETFSSDTIVSTCEYSQFLEITMGGSFYMTSRTKSVWLEDHMNEVGELYCDKYGCELKKICRSYCLVTGNEYIEPIVETKEESNTSQNDEITITLSEVRRDADISAENIMNVYNNDEERAYAWVAARGGNALNITQTQERSE
tara:strand:- start:365 stop:1849 length:1485 start_codon:yes stop_codon:yes gene_type:complete